MSGPLVDPLVVAESGEEITEQDQGIGSELQYFSEKDRCCEILSTICKDLSGHLFTAQCDELISILDKYLEQPLLVTVHIVELVAPVNASLIDIVTTTEDSTVRIDAIGKVVYGLCRVVGYKHTMKHFPHEVHHLEGCLALLKGCEDGRTSWEGQYMLLHWLAALSLIPFDLSSMDSGVASSSPSLLTRIVDVSKRHLSDTGPTREAAAVCVSALLTRPDMESQHLSDFMAWAIGLLTSWSLIPGSERASLTPQYFSTLGVLHGVFQIFKLGNRVKLQPYGPRLLPYCTNLLEVTRQTAARKLLTKLVQRIGMNFLPPQVAAWRYMRGSRSLNLVSKRQGDSTRAIRATAGSNMGGADGAVHSEAVMVSDGHTDAVPDEMEDVIDALLCSMRDKDTVVRWSAAKGIGRIAMRLPREHAADVVDAVLEAFAEEGADNNWHGACLTLAELARRGLLLPERLAGVIPFIGRAIRFDVLRGQHSIGAHVRDAACYVCWAFSRAYTPAVMAPFIRTLTTALLTTTLFDREINCRRAASAAYQETVGRQGAQNVPNGIEIITVADFVSVGNRVACFTTLAPVVAGLEESLPAAFIAHLTAVSMNHWDRDMRDLAGRALASLVPCCASIVAAQLPEIVRRCTSANLCVRHGALVALAELLFAVTAHGEAPSEDLVVAVLDVVPSIEKARLYRGRGGELVREAVAQLVRSIARSRLPLSVKQQVVLVEALNEHLRQPHQAVQLAARDALREFLFAYFSTGDVPSERLQKLTVAKYLDGLRTETNVSVTRGYGLALGALPLRLLVLPHGTIDHVLACLTECCSPQHRINGEYDADTCSNCVASLSEIAERLCYAKAFGSGHAEKCFEVLRASCADYSVDNRGDTGSWSRVQAMKGTEALIYALLRRATHGAWCAGGICAVGQEWESSAGVGCLTRVEVVSSEVTVLQIEYSPHSFGANAPTSQELLVCRKGLVCGFGGSGNDSRAGATTADGAERDELLRLLNARLVEVTGIVLKQLSEKLDAVRDVAGGVLLRLLRCCASEKELQFPDSELVSGVLAERMASLGRPALHEEMVQAVNWAHPAHVYPIVCALLKSRIFFLPILSGLVVSVGGLSETTARVSAQSLVEYWSAHRESPAGLEVGMALVSMLVENRRIERVVVPVVKTLLLMVNEGMLDAQPAQAKAAIAASLFAALAAEAKGSSSLSKVRLMVELQVRMLSLCAGAELQAGLLSALPMLTHKYPLIRKYCAELLYMFLLSDERAVCAPSRGDALFASQARLDEAVQLLSCTGWEADDKVQLVAARVAVTRCMGFAEAAEALAAGVARDALAATGRGAGRATGAGSDELDSYEALVRDAGY